jgi:hypothetical protein
MPFSFPTQRTSGPTSLKLVCACLRVCFMRTAYAAGLRFLLRQRAAAAFLAMALRLAGESRAARARPPSFPSARAAASAGFIAVVVEPCFQGGAHGSPEALKFVFVLLDGLALLRDGFVELFDVLAQRFLGLYEEFYSLFDGHLICASFELSAKHGWPALGAAFLAGVDVTSWCVWWLDVWGLMHGGCMRFVLSGPAVAAAGFA